MLTLQNKKKIMCQIRQTGRVGGPESGEVGGKAGSCSVHVLGRICRQNLENGKTDWQ